MLKKIPTRGLLEIKEMILATKMDEKEKVLILVVEIMVETWKMEDFI
jgi:hypothetical protein